MASWFLVSRYDRVTALHCFIVASAAQDPKVAMLIAQAKQQGLSVDLVSGLDGLESNREFLEARRPIVLLADVGSRPNLPADALRFARAQVGHAFLLYVSDSIDPDIYKQLLRTEAADCSKWEMLPIELSDIVKRSPLKNAAPVSNAKILCFFPSKGGVGNTTLAVEAAISLASPRSKHVEKIALLDLNLDGGTLADALDIEARFDLHEIANHPERLDNQLIDVFASRRSDRLDVFAMPPRRATAGEVSPQIIFALLDLLAGRYDVILIDMENQRSAWNDNLLKGSDVVIVTGISTVPALKQLRVKLSQLDDLMVANSKIAVIVNQCEKGMLGQIARRKEVDRALPGRRLFFVRNDLEAAHAAANAGRPLIELLPNSQISGDIRKLVAWIGSTIGSGVATAIGRRP